MLAGTCFTQPPHSVLYSGAYSQSSPMKKTLLPLLMAFRPFTHGHSWPGPTMIPLCRPGFVYEDIYRGHGMTAIDFDPTGAMYVCEKMGRVLLFEPKGPDFNDPVMSSSISAKAARASSIRTTKAACWASPSISVQLQHQPLRLRFLHHQHRPAARALHAQSGTRNALEATRSCSCSGLPRTHTNHKAGDIHFSPKDPNAIYITLGNDAVQNSAQLVDNLDRLQRQSSSA